MKLIITYSIFHHEFKPLRELFDLKSIKLAAKKSLQGLGNNLKNFSSISSTQLNKIYLTSKSSAGRAVFLLEINKNHSILVLIRPKKDKQIGSNMSISNPKFKILLERNLDFIIKDLKNGNFYEYDL